MNTFEAIELLTEGKKIRNKKWAEGEYILLNNFTHNIINEKDEIIEVLLGNFLAFPETDCWETFEEINKWRIEPTIEVGICPHCNRAISSYKVPRFKYCPYCGKQNLFK